MYRSLTESLISSLAFANHAKHLKKDIVLLEKFKLPELKIWKVNWSNLHELCNGGEKGNWKALDIYHELLAHKNRPAVYFFTLFKGSPRAVYDLFKEQKIKSSRIRINKGVGDPDFINISHVPKEFNNSSCMYVGSRRKSINERFKQHLGYGSGRTGALHLTKIFEHEKSLPGINFNYCLLDEKYRAITEQIECVMQNHLKPFIGKNILGD